MRRKKQSFTLLEVMIGMALVSILLVLLFSNFSSSSIAAIKTKAAEHSVHQRLCLQARLMQVFDHLDFEIKNKSFYTAPHQEALGMALYFQFYQEIDHDPQFIGTLKGVLFINVNKQLCLQIQSESGAIRKEIFLNDQKELSFRFFDSHQASWEESWKQEIPYSPTFIKLQLREKEMKSNERLEFAFAVKGTPSDITYYKEQK